MDPVYQHIFDDLYKRWDPHDPNRSRIAEAAGFRSAEPVRTIRRTIEEADARLAEAQGLSLRSDARYFLLLNLSEMVVRPIQMRTGAPPFNGPSEELDRVLRVDLDLLLPYAASLHTEGHFSRRGGPQLDRQISGHSIVEALAANWTRLRLNSYRIWGEP